MQDQKRDFTQSGDQLATTTGHKVLTRLDSIVSKTKGANLTGYRSEIEHYLEEYDPLEALEAVHEAFNYCIDNDDLKGLDGFSNIVYQFKGIQNLLIKLAQTQKNSCFNAFCGVIELKNDLNNQRREAVNA